MTEATKKKTLSTSIWLCLPTKRKPTSGFRVQPNLRMARSSATKVDNLRNINLNRDWKWVTNLHRICPVCTAWNGLSVLHACTCGFKFTRYYSPFHVSYTKKYFQFLMIQRGRSTWYTPRTEIHDRRVDSFIATGQSGMQHDFRHLPHQSKVATITHCKKE